MLSRRLARGTAHRAAAGMLSTARYCSDDGLSPELRAQLKHLIEQDKMVVFLTGTPMQPRCGFTMRMVELLQQFGVKYTPVNILESDDVCEGLKVYSNWPTYPQVYIDGELIGGWDVVREMAVDGSLVTLFQEKGLLQS